MRLMDIPPNLWQKRAATPLQFTVQVIDVLHRAHAGSPSLWRFCKLAMGDQGARRAEKALRCMRERKGGGRSGHKEGDMAGVFRWFSGALRGVALAALARARWQEILAGPMDTVPLCCEGAVCLHLAAMQAADLPALAGSAFEALVSDPVGTKGRVLRGLVLHLSTDAGLDLSPWLLRHRSCYEPSDLAFSLALVAASCPGASAEAALASLVREVAGDPVGVGLVAAHLCLRLAAYGADRAAAGHWSQIRAAVGEQLRAVPVAAFVSHAGRYDYGVDLAQVVRRGGGEVADIGALVEGALRWLDPQRRRARGESGFGPAAYAAATQRFARWGLTHAVCRPLFQGLPSLDVAGWRLLGLLAERGQELPLLNALDAHLTGWIKDTPPFGNLYNNKLAER